MSAEILRRAAAELHGDASLQDEDYGRFLHAVADWLEKTAVAIEHGGSHALFAREALAVARAYLGEAADA